MASEAELLALADRCEAASGADRELDADIALAIGWKHRSGQDWHRVLPWERPEYTASLDAAMTLVPEGWWWSTGDCSVSADASCGPDVAHCSKELLVQFDNGIHVDIDQPSTPALALCSVALRARAAIAVLDEVRGK